MHWFRDGGRQQSRILYAFRSPGGVRVGRSPLDPEILREIEAGHPDIHFDWNTVLGNQQVIEAAPDVRRPRRRVAPPIDAQPAPPAAEPRSGGQTDPLPAHVSAPAPTPAPARPHVPPSIQGETLEERLAFLAHWHPQVVERISQRGGDPERQAGLLALAGRLDPTGWTNPDAAAVGLPGAAEALEQLSRLLGRRRRRSRRGRRTGEAADATDVSATAETDEETSAGEDGGAADADGGEVGGDEEGEPA